MGRPLVIFLILSFIFLGERALVWAVIEEPKKIELEEKENRVLSITFADYYARVLNYYPVLKRQHAKVEEAVAQRLQAFGGLLPSVRGLTSVAASDNPGLVLNTLLRQNSLSSHDLVISNLNDPETRTNFNFSLQGEFPLFNAFQTISRIRAARHLVASERLQEDLSRAEASLLAVETYLNVLLLKSVVNRIQDVRKASSGDIKQAEDLKDKGLILGADFYAAKVIHGGMTQLENQAIFELRKALILFNILMGENPEKEYELAGVMPEPREKTNPFIEWLHISHEKRWDLLALEKRIQAQKSEVFREKSSILPRVSAFAELHEDSHDLRSGGESYVAGFRGSADLLDPAYPGRVKKAKAILRELEATRTTLRDSIARDVAGVFSIYETVRFNTPVARGMFEDAKEAVSSIEPLYREGRKDIADLLEIRKAFLDTGTAFDELLVRSEVSYARLSFLAGGLDESEMREIAGRIGGDTQ